MMKQKSNLRKIGSKQQNAPIMSEQIQPNIFSVSLHQALKPTLGEGFYDQKLYND